MKVCLPGRIIAVLLAMIIVIVVATKLRGAQRREALEHIREKERQSGLALVRYVMLNRQCSEEAAYQRIAMFVKNQFLLDEHSSIERMLAGDRQSLLDRTRSILVHDPNAIDKI